MSQPSVLREDGFILEFHVINNVVPRDKGLSLRETIGDGYVLQERIILPPRLIPEAGSFSVSSFVPSRSNQPLIIIGHPDLPVQYASIIARPKRKKTRIEKYNKAIKLSTKGLNLLFSAPLFSPSVRTAQALFSAFSEIRQMLRDCDMGDAVIGRTWLLMENILRDYDLLNKAREKFFKEQFVSLPFFPASTSIQSPILGSTILSVEFCAFSGEALSLRQQTSPLQKEPMSYGKMFSRAVIAFLPKNSLLFISGTASIDKTGATVHEGDFERQMTCILEVVSSILRQVNGTFADIAQAMIYLKRTKDFASCLSICDEVGFPVARTLFQIDTPVCRDELLCEMEVTAILTDQQKASHGCDVDSGIFLLKT
jgi:enamine deaminase RidA (YjgF/YER057c/UK114 family)